MKTAVSIPDPLFKAAERVAKRRGLSRSRLYAEAIAAYLRSLSAEDVTSRLDAVYAKSSNSLHPSLKRLAGETLKREPDAW
jgi:hypothetical protein